ncbi:uncharacterized protein MONOS_6643 [Monocercomonoides exilis]|uniref:uncharacterized protein n=1 Tax=Monocercomonoides exilis TaxID=2049356 RepID=UPI003559BA98|nr:hypothetical protein MONOS_6643 [Monocercomonoides exilis]|eukprot:MONOS_6643.1-p1 / transcript=MONOS_6643.1 / gene=MONOS_6643 / organism=Monocercomonoides_exilis_PA203 / gene_product=unspecified product / transcript_product=unspecified product / location=Mono_scaffold00213:3884-9538(+) / protein_length=1885 / sequence_SO=supercontig / SO=protein_coding / is_pseudo=false
MNANESLELDTGKYHPTMKARKKDMEVVKRGKEGIDEFGSLVYLFLNLAVKQCNPTTSDTLPTTATPPGFSSVKNPPSELLLCSLSLCQQWMVHITYIEALFMFPIPQILVSLLNPPADTSTLSLQTQYPLSSPLLIDLYHSYLVPLCITLTELVSHQPITRGEQKLFIKNTSNSSLLQPSSYPSKITPLSLSSLTTPDSSPISLSLTSGKVLFNSLLSTLLPRLSDAFAFVWSLKLSFDSEASSAQFPFQQLTSTQTSSITAASGSPSTSCGMNRINEELQSLTRLTSEVFAVHSSTMLSATDAVVECERHQILRDEAEHLLLQWAQSTCPSQQRTSHNFGGGFCSASGLASSQSMLTAAPPPELTTLPPFTPPSFELPPQFSDWLLFATRLLSAEGLPQSALDDCLEILESVSHSPQLCFSASPSCDDAPVGSSFSSSSSPSSSSSSSLTFTRASMPSAMLSRSVSSYFDSIPPPSSFVRPGIESMLQPFFRSIVTIALNQMTSSLHRIRTSYSSLSSFPSSTSQMQLQSPVRSINLSSNCCFTVMLNAIRIAHHSLSNGVLPILGESLLQTGIPLLSNLRALKDKALSETIRQLEVIDNGMKADATNSSKRLSSIEKSRIITEIVGYALCSSAEWDSVCVILSAMRAANEELLEPQAILASCSENEEADGDGWNSNSNSDSDDEEDDAPLYISQSSQNETQNLQSQSQKMQRFAERIAPITNAITQTGQFLQQCVQLCTVTPPSLPQSTTLEATTSNASTEFSQGDITDNNHSVVLLPFLMVRVSIDWIGSLRQWASLPQTLPMCFPLISSFVVSALQHHFLFAFDSTEAESELKGRDAPGIYQGAGSLEERALRTGQLFEAVLQQKSVEECFSVNKNAIISLFNTRISKELKLQNEMIKSKMEFQTKDDFEKLETKEEEEEEESLEQIDEDNMFALHSSHSEMTAEQLLSPLSIPPVNFSALFTGETNLIPVQINQQGKESSLMARIHKWDISHLRIDGTFSSSYKNTSISRVASASLLKIVEGISLSSSVFSSLSDPNSTRNVLFQRLLSLSHHLMLIFCSIDFPSQLYAAKCVSLILEKVTVAAKKMTGSANQQTSSASSQVKQQQTGANSSLQHELTMQKLRTPLLPQFDLKAVYCSIISSQMHHHQIFSQYLQMITSESPITSTEFPSNSLLVNQNSNNLPLSSSLHWLFLCLTDLILGQLPSLSSYSVFSQEELKYFMKMIILTLSHITAVLQCARSPSLSSSLSSTMKIVTQLWEANVISQMKQNTLSTPFLSDNSSSSSMSLNTKNLLTRFAQGCVSSLHPLFFCIQQRWQFIANNVTFLLSKLILPVTNSSTSEINSVQSAPFLSPTSPNATSSLIETPKTASSLSISQNAQENLFMTLSSFLISLRHTLSSSLLLFAHPLFDCNFIPSLCSFIHPPSSNASFYLSSSFVDSFSHFALLCSPTTSESPLPSPLDDSAASSFVYLKPFSSSSKIWLTTPPQDELSLFSSEMSDTHFIITPSAFLFSLRIRLLCQLWLAYHRSLQSAAAHLLHKSPAAAQAVTSVARFFFRLCTAIVALILHVQSEEWFESSYASPRSYAALPSHIFAFFPFAASLINPSLLLFTSALFFFAERDTTTACLEAICAFISLYAHCSAPLKSFTSNQSNNSSFSSSTGGASLSSYHIARGGDDILLFPDFVTVHSTPQDKPSFFSSQTLLSPLSSFWKEWTCPLISALLHALSAPPRPMQTSVALLGSALLPHIPSLSLDRAPQTAQSFHSFNCSQTSVDALVQLMAESAKESASTSSMRQPTASSSVLSLVSSVGGVLPTHHKSILSTISFLISLLPSTYEKLILTAIKSSPALRGKTSLEDILRKVKETSDGKRILQSQQLNLP